jgi:hypothetical protein
MWLGQKKVIDVDAWQPLGLAVQRVEMAVGTEMVIDGGEVVPAVKLGAEDLWLVALGVNTVCASMVQKCSLDITFRL